MTALAQDQLHRMIRKLRHLPSRRGVALATWVILFGGAVAARGHTGLAVIAASVLILMTYKLFGVRQAACVGVGASAVVLLVPWPIAIYLGLAAAIVLVPEARTSIGRVTTSELLHPCVVLMGLVTAGICIVLSMWQS